MSSFLTDLVPESDFKIEYYDGSPKRLIEGSYSNESYAHLLRASGRASAGQVEIVMERHPILRYTPAGAWIDTWQGDKFVNLRATKQWASATAEEAIDQLYHRKRKQVHILDARLEEAKEVQAAMEKHLGKKPPVRHYRSCSEYDYY